MKNKYIPWKVVVTLFGDKDWICTHDSYDRAKQAAESMIRAYKNFESVKLIKV